MPRCDATEIPPYNLREHHCEIVEEKKRVEVRGVAEAEGRAQMPRPHLPSWLDLMSRFTGRIDIVPPAGKVYPLDAPAANAW